MRLIPITKLVNHEVAYLIKELWEAIDNTNKRLDTLADDNQQLMAQISAKDETEKPKAMLYDHNSFNVDKFYREDETEITFSYGDVLNRIATALEAIAEAVRPILITKEIQ